MDLGCFSKSIRNLYSLFFVVDVCVVLGLLGYCRRAAA